MAWSASAVFIILQAMLKVCLYLSIRGTFSLLQTVGWFISGTSRQRKENWDPQHYGNSAHILKVWARYKLSPLVLPNSLMDFIAVHSHFAHPNVVLRDNVTLYTVKPAYAVFVETDESVKVTTSDMHPFMKAGQYSNARSIILLPRHAFDRLADEVGKPDAKLIFMGNTMRCGSTLMCQAFEKSGQCLSFAEPDVIHALHQLHGTLQEDDFNRLTCSSINLLFKPVASKPKAYMVKIMGHAMSSTLTPLWKLYPDCILLFMYRDGLPMVKSVSRLVQQEPIARVVNAILQLFPSLNKFALAISGSSNDNIPEAASNISPFASTVYAWASLCDSYNSLRRKGMPIAAIKYEDLIQNPAKSLEIIFRHCGLDIASVSNALKAFEQDSQRNSILSRTSLSKHTAGELTDEDKVRTDAICDHYGLPRIPEPCVLDATITHSE